MKTQWDFSANAKLGEYLSPTRLCDIEHPLVQQVTRQVVGDAITSKEAAVRIFYFVRDTIGHEWAGMGKRASEILMGRRGDCWLKSVLQVAMLRAANIPARFRWIEFRKTLFGDLVPKVIYDRLHDSFPFHVFVEVWLGRWIKADATFDKLLAPSKAKDWDGESDVEVVVGTDLVADRGTTATFDEKMEEIKQYLEKTTPTERIQTEEKFDRESEVVNLYFGFVRFKNRLEQQLTKIMKAK